jgi:polyribonucleotide nucleotidyltransferase
VVERTPDKGEVEGSIPSTPNSKDSKVKNMSKISPKRRQFEIRKKRKRKQKIKKLREKYFKAKDEKERMKILEKMKKICPHLSEKELLGEKKGP